MAGRDIDRITQSAFDEAARRVRAGQEFTEYDLQQWIMGQFRAGGVTADSLPIVAVGPHAGDPHYEPKERGSAPVREGDLLLLDIWGKTLAPNSVYYDITWTGYLGAKVPEKYANIFRIVREARDAAVDFVRNGVKAGRAIEGWQVDRAPGLYTVPHKIDSRIAGFAHDPENVGILFRHLGAQISRPSNIVVDAVRGQRFSPNVEQQQIACAHRRGPSFFRFVMRITGVRPDRDDWQRIGRHAAGAKLSHDPLLQVVFREVLPRAYTARRLGKRRLRDAVDLSAGHSMRSKLLWRPRGFELLYQVRRA